MALAADHICVVIGRTRHKMIQAEIQEAAKRGARMLEIRLDFLAKAPDFKRLLANKPCQMVATARRKEEGGRWTGNETDRRLLLRQAIAAGFDWVDLEEEVAADIKRYRHVKRIISYHNLQEMPGDLERIYARLCELDPDVIKIAVAANRPQDNLRVFELLKNPPIPTIAFCLGELGFPSRILGARFNVPFTYAAFNKERALGLGIPNFDDMRRLYRYPSINAQTQIFGVIGDPVAHSLSPAIHNRALKECGINGVYLPFRVPQGELPEFLDTYERFGVRGYSVTIPHKEAALAASKHPDAAASLVGAANTLTRAQDGYVAWNTDYQAARDSLMAHLPRDPSGETRGVDGKPVLILGAGGVGRAVAHALHREGAILLISNRSMERAQQLAEEIGCRFVPWEFRHEVACSVLVNATSVGMHPNVDEMPIHPSFMTEGMMVFDTVYTPENTLLIKEARSRGCQVLTGVDMFIRQAEMQFKLFTGRPPPEDLMRDLVKRALSPVALVEEET
jgi:3-dehydroquinate dehydratase/shikimate dehydrogenase